MQDKTKCPLKKLGLPIIIASAIVLAALIVYLAVSLATRKWDTTWLIIIGGASLAVIVFSGFLISKYTKREQYLIPRISLAVSIVLAFVVIYLCISVLAEVNKAWIMFLIMVIAAIGADTVFAYWVNSKTRLVNLLVFILAASVLEYVVLALVDLLDWHPYWIIPLVGFLIDVAIVAIKFKDIFRKKQNEEEIVSGGVEHAPGSEQVRGENKEEQAVQETVKEEEIAESGETVKDGEPEEK